MNTTDLANQLLERMTGIPATEWDGHRFGPMLREQRRRMAADTDLMTMAADDMDKAVTLMAELAVEHVRAAFVAASTTDRAA